MAIAMDTGGEGVNSQYLDDYYRAKEPTESHEVETRVQKLISLSRSRFPSAQKEKKERGRADSKDGETKREKSEKSKPKAETAEAHVLGAWLQDEHVLELIKLHADGKKTGSGNTKSQPEVPQTKAKDKGTGKTMLGAAEPKHDAGMAIPTAPDQMSSGTNTRRTLISL